MEEKTHPSERLKSLLRDDVAEADACENNEGGVDALEPKNRSNKTSRDLMSAHGAQSLFLAGACSVPVVVGVVVGVVVARQ